MTYIAPAECIQCGRDFDIFEHAKLDTPEGAHQFRISFTLGADALAAYSVLMQGAGDVEPRGFLSATARPAPPPAPNPGTVMKGI